MNSAGLVDLLYEIVLSEVQEEKDRFETIEGKATTILGQLGIVASVVTTGAALVTQYEQSQKTLGPYITVAAGFLFCLAIGFGVASAVMAIRAVRVEALEVRPSERTLLDVEVLREADHIERQTKDPQAGKSLYLRTVTEHFWQIRENYHKANELKADHAQWAQTLFAGFLIAITLVGAVFVVGTILGARSASGARAETATTQETPPNASSTSARQSANQGTSAACLWYGPSK